MTDIARRKADHLDLTISGDVGFKHTTTLFECLRLVHDALPELELSAVDTNVTVLGKTLSAPLLIAGMTGGTERAEGVNKQLAAIAEEQKIAFGLGSQRAMLKDPARAKSYKVRTEAPSALILGNIGGVQAAAMSTQQTQDLVGEVGADALCIHLNPAMELIQGDGDRNFVGVLQAITRLAEELPVPVIAKETGCGMSRDVLARLQAAGVRHVDVSGAGGTSWVGVETERADPERRRLGETFWEWGIPTAASTAFAAETGFETIFATGGMKTGLDVCKAVALGATAGGIARPVLQALDAGGPDGARRFLEGVMLEFRSSMLLSGAGSCSALRRKPRLVTGELERWLGGAR